MQCTSIGSRLPFETIEDKHCKHKQQYAFFGEPQIALSLISLVLALCMCTVAGTTGRIAPGSFRSVVFHRDQVYAADINKNQTQVFEYNDTPSPRWTHIRSIEHDFEQNGLPLTLSISNNQLNCCSNSIGSIKVYSLSGELLQTYGTRGCGGDDKLNCPFIGDDDDDGSVLIVEYHINRLLVMSEQGEIGVLQLQPPVSGPRSAVLFNNQLYVTSWDDEAIYRYSC